MTFIVWAETMQLDLKAIDDEHRQLAELINRLHDAIHIRQPLGTLRPILIELEAYADAHFSDEEQLMSMHRCPADEIKRHAGEHEEFRACLRSLAHDFDTDQATLRLDLWQFVASWWNRHVEGTDQQLARAINAGSC